jgi:ribose-phosphate pyrophosphokinase
MNLFAGSSHPELGQALAKQLGVQTGKIVLKTFSCGECYVKYEQSMRGQDVYLLQTGTKRANEDLMELFLMCQAAKLSFAKTVHVILPFFAYSRQDRVAEPREPISAKLVASLLEQAGADHVITLDLHSDQIQGFFNIPADALDSRPVFASYFKAKNLKDAVVVAPDAGGAKRAKKFADLIGADLAIMHKNRSAHSQAEILEVVGCIEGKTCIIFDDIIDTAGTLAAAKQALIKRKANKDVYAAATHAVFSGKALENLKKAGFKEVVITDSIPLASKGGMRNLTVLPIAPMLAQVIRNIESGQSVTEIYKRK